MFSHLFLLGCHKPINIMRKAGLNDGIIASIIQDIRSYTLNEEFNRLKELMIANPPHHHPWGEMFDAIEKVIKE